MISGIIHMLKSGGRWADCPSAYGPSTTVYNRWNRWSRRGLWRKLLSILSGQGPLDDLAMLDPTCVKAHRSAYGGKGGPKAQAIGVSRGGQTSKIHAVCDLLDRPVALALTAGHVSDIRAAELLTAEAIRFRRLVATRATTPTASAGRCARLEPRPSFPAAPTASGASATTSAAIATAG